MYPSRSYALSLNRGPAVIGAPQFSAATGAGGAGVKVAVVDDGVDHEHLFLDPAGYAYPPGYPRRPGRHLAEGDRIHGDLQARGRTAPRSTGRSRSTARSSPA